MDLNKTKSELEQKFFNLSNEIVQSCELELYDMEYITSQSLLRVFIMDPNTNTAEIDDCVKVDRAFSEPCEELAWIPDSLILEVSSPGVYRKLKTQKHFELARGQRITCTLSGDLSEDQKQVLPKSQKNSKKLSAKLKEVTSENICLDFESHELLLDYAKIKKAQLDPVI